jgi:hypothetical protein
MKCTQHPEITLTVHPRSRHTPSRSSPSSERLTGCWPRAVRSPKWPSTWRSARRPIPVGGPQHGGLKADDVKRLKELEGENARLKRIVADKELQIQALMELGRGKLVSPARRRRAVEHLQQVFGVS